MLTAGLSATYVLAWVAFGTHLPVRERVATAAGTAERDAAMWLAFLRGARASADLLAHTPGIGAVLVSHEGVAEVVGDLEVLHG